jgi:WS/DGAT/MGAT family acyltransferase
MPDEPEIHVMGAIERLVDGIDHERRRVVGRVRRSLGALAGAAASAGADAAGTARRLGETIGSVGRMLAPATEPLSPIMQSRSLSVHFDTITVPLADLKSASKRADGRLNDAFVAAVAGGLRRYHEHHGASVPQLRMTMPINIRDETTADLAGNQFVPARFAVPVDIDVPVERMATVRDPVQAQRAEPALALTEPLAGLLYRLPTTVSTAVFGSMLRGVDFVTSNVPGVPIPIYLAGARMDAQFAFGPMSGAAMNITLLSYLDEVQIAVNTDPAAVPDPDVLQSSLIEGFAEICKLA